MSVVTRARYARIDGYLLNAVLQTGVLEHISLTILRSLTIVAFLVIAVTAAHVLVRELRNERGQFRYREARLVLVGAGTLFVTWFAQLVVADGVAHESLTAVALGFTAVAYLLYSACPALFEMPESVGTRRRLTRRQPTEGSDANSFYRPPHATSEGGGGGFQWSIPTTVLSRRYGTVLTIGQAPTPSGTTMPIRFVITL